ncbi:hypothetical protein C8J56DRAFT_168987 [Mycena floridula]|nr:hypothetical protein C8J56DRAFT_168987 [Mycena floridula]
MLYGPLDPVGAAMVHALYPGFGIVSELIIIRVCLKYATHETTNSGHSSPSIGENILLQKTSGPKNLDIIAETVDHHSLEVQRKSKGTFLKRCDTDKVTDILRSYLGCLRYKATSPPMTFDLSLEAEVISKLASWSLGFEKDPLSLKIVRSSVGIADVSLRYPLEQT